MGREALSSVYLLGRFAMKPSYVQPLYIQVKYVDIFHRGVAVVIYEDFVSLNT